MRKVVAPVVCSLMMLSVALSGCSVKVQAGEPQPEPKKPAAAPPPPAPTPAPEPAKKPSRLGGFRSFKKVGNQVELPGPVLFVTGSDKLLPESDPVLEIVEAYLKQETKVTLLRIEGHTDSDGDEAKNQDLSQRRAMAVAKWLTAKGIDCKRLLPVGFGETKPIADNDTAEGKAKNRRVSFFDAAIDGKPAEKGKPVDGGGKNAGDPCQ
jgi:OOP family OmpA-OmpF porin